MVVQRVSTNGSRVTITDVARQAGVSMATVSRVMNRQHSGDTVVRERVLSVAQQLGYQPSMAARLLAGGRGGTSMHFVLTSFQSLVGFYGDILKGAEQEGRRLGQDLYLSTESGHMAVLANGRVPTGISGESVRGVIAGTLSEEFYATCREVGLPLVLINTWSATTPCDCVLCDNFAATYRTIRWLVELGHRRIACIASEYPSNVTSWERVMGYRQALADAGISADPQLLVTVAHWTEECGAEAMARLAADGAAPTAALCTSDETAVGAISWAHKAGVRVPEELSVLGVNDLEMAARCDPPLTTIRIHREEVGRAAVQRLMQLVSDPGQAPRRIDVLCELVVRESCARAPSLPSRVLSAAGPSAHANRHLKPSRSGLAREAREGVLPPAALEGAAAG